MDSLFPELDTRPPLPELPPGFSYERDFLSVAEERALLEGIAALPLQNSTYHEYTARRRTIGFGLRWNYDTSSLHRVEPAPDFLSALAEKVARHVDRDPREFPHVLVTEYPPGAPIGWHRDAPPFAVIHGVSLLSPCSFRLRPHALALQARVQRSPDAAADAQRVARVGTPAVEAARAELKRQTISLTVEPRSLYVMAGRSRSEWQHGIPPVKQTRYSITLRTLR
jgi:alkylated DNA repair dioxygenase AlkB